MLSLVLGASTHIRVDALGLYLWPRLRRLLDEAPHRSHCGPLRLLGVVQVVMGLLAIATLPLYGAMFDAMTWIMKGVARTETGYALYHVSSHFIALAIMFPATFCAVMTLPLITYALLRRGYGEKSIGAVYSANTLGAILGVFAAAHLGLPLLGLKNLIAAGAAIDALLGVYLLWRAARAAAARPYLGPAISVAAALRPFGPRSGFPGWRQIIRPRPALSSLRPRPAAWRFRRQRAAWSRWR